MIEVCQFVTGDEGSSVGFDVIRWSAGAASMLDASAAGATYLSFTLFSVFGFSSAFLRHSSSTISFPR